MVRLLVGFLLLFTACRAPDNRPTSLPSPAAPPAARPTSERLTLQVVTAGLRQPTALAEVPDGSGRFFVLERAGLVRLLRQGQLVPEPVLDLRTLITSSGQEQGLLGIAFHPRFGENGRFFLASTARNGDNTVAEYRLAAGADQVDPLSGRVLLAIPDFASNHNGGHLAFGPDGYLYIGTGDGGGAGDPQRTAQNLGSLLGKLLRLDVDRGEPYAIPPDNPFRGQPDARPEIWALGLRNPWRYSFDRQTGDLWIADVGQNLLEEVDYIPAGTPGGLNFGWSIMEGSRCFRTPTCESTGLVLPVAEYSRELGCSITGGYVYRGSALPWLVGTYLYGDYCSGRVWGLTLDGQGGWVTTELLHDPTLRLSSFAEDLAGELYLIDLGGRILRLTAE
ncbi:MAG: glucose dehydrogenase [Dehalococcoidia bacterium]|nr:MAG: glucose dehydrogenase [Dehalococcoidia bacterium]